MMRSLVTTPIACMFLSSADLAQATVPQVVYTSSYTTIDPTGSTDSTAGLTSALNAATGGILYVLPGVYITSPLTVPTGTAVACDNGAVFRRAPSATVGTPVIGVNSNDTVSGCEIDLNSPASTNVTTGIAPVASSQNVTIDHNYVHGGAFTCINYTSYGGTLVHYKINITNNIVSNCGWVGIQAENATNVLIGQNQIQSTGYSIISTLKVTDAKVVGNNENNLVAPTILYSGAGALGHVVDAFVTFDFQSNGLDISDNEFNNNQGFDGIGASENGHNCSANIRIHHNKINGVFGAGIDTTCNEIVDDNIITNAAANCILIGYDYGGPMFSLDVHDNTCVNTGNSAGAAAAIRFAHPVRYAMSLTTTSGSTTATLVSAAPIGGDGSDGQALPLIITGQLLNATNIPANDAVTAFSGSTVTLASAATATATAHGLAQGVTTYTDVSVHDNTAVDYRSPQYTNAGLLFEGLNQNYTRVVEYGDHFDGLTTGVYGTLPSSGIKSSQIISYTPTLTWTGGTSAPTGAVVGAKFSTLHKRLTYDFVIGSGTNLNGTTGLAISIPGTPVLDDTTIVCHNDSTGALLYAIAPAGGTSFALGAALATNQYYACNADGIAVQ